MALEDQASLPTLQSMLHGESIAASTAASWKVLWHESTKNEEASILNWSL
jgi:hypothetical protein